MGSLGTRPSTIERWASVGSPTCGHMVSGPWCRPWEWGDSGQGRAQGRGAASGRKRCSNEEPCWPQGPEQGQVGRNS